MYVITLRLSARHCIACTEISFITKWSFRFRKFEMILVSRQAIIHSLSPESNVFAARYKLLQTVRENSYKIIVKFQAIARFIEFVEQETLLQTLSMLKHVLHLIDFAATDDKVARTRRSSISSGLRRFVAIKRKRKEGAFFDRMRAAIFKLNPIGGTFCERASFDEIARWSIHLSNGVG